MAAIYGDLEDVVNEKPLSLSPWKQINNSNDDHSCFSEIFNELYVHSSPETSTSSTPSSLSSDSSFFVGMKKKENRFYMNMHKRDTCVINNWSEGYFSDNSSTCTEGLGFESFNDDILESIGKLHEEERTISVTRNLKTGRLKASSRLKASFPPPISSMGINGKPLVCFKSFRQNGRFVLKEVRARNNEFLNASREDGHLRLRFVHSDDECFYEDEEGDDQESTIIEECYENIDKDIDGANNKNCVL